MMRKIIPIMSIMLMMSLAVNSAVIECNWSGETCSPKTGTPITQPYEVITITGKPTNYINTVTTLLYFNEFFITRYIPANMLTIFTNVQWLQMSNSGVSNLAANLSMNCPVLERMIIDDGTIQEVPEGFLQTCSNVILICIRQHQITTVDKNAFRGLAKLQTLEITRNKITCLHPALFLHTPVLLRAFFTYNKINALDRNLLSPLTKIAFFDVKHNSLTYLPVLNLNSSATGSMAFWANGNPIYAINPNFCSTFANRPTQFYDNFLVKGIPCLPNDTLLDRIYMQNCQTSASVLQSCYANWTPTMSENVVCGQGSGYCIPSNIWSKFTEFVKYLPL